MRNCEPTFIIPTFIDIYIEHIVIQDWIIHSVKFFFLLLNVHGAPSHTFHLYVYCTEGSVGYKGNKSALEHS